MATPAAWERIGRNTLLDDFIKIAIFSVQVIPFFLVIPVFLVRTL